MSKSTINLMDSVMLAGKEVKELIMDFDNLRGIDLIEAEKNTRALGETNPVLMLSTKYYVVIAAKLTGLTFDEIIEMNAVDFIKITNEVSRFLTRGL